MTTMAESMTTAAAQATTAHPLDPLTPDEIRETVRLLKAAGHVGARTRFQTIALKEPDKALVRSYKAGDAVPREAFICAFDGATAKTYEAIVSLSAGEVTSWTHIPGVQPGVMLEEFLECEETVKADAGFRAALKKRGITDVDLVMVEPWSAGHYGVPEEEGQRLCHTFCWLKTSEHDNGYVRPIEGLCPVVDLNAKKVMRLDDHGALPLPPEEGNYNRHFIKDYRTDLKPLEITQPEGPSFTVEGQKVTWQNWHFRIGFTPREGVVLHEIGFEDQGRVRPIIYRASLAEMVVPYGDPSGGHYRKNAFDIGEYGIGSLTNSLMLGCDCVGVVHYFDACLSSAAGEPVEIKNAICMHEEDYGILWKHWDWRTDETEVRRSRRLVVSFIVTVGNYDYGYYWYFYQDGTIQLECKLTGIINMAAAAPGAKPKYGTLVAPQVVGHIHQHVFNIRLDMSVDGDENSVLEVDTVAEKLGPNNPAAGAFYAKEKVLKSELKAQRTIDFAKARNWKIVNPNKKNRMGAPVGYRLMPGTNAAPFSHPDASVAKRAQFMTKHLWVTPYRPDEMYPAGRYINQSEGGEGLAKWTQADRSVENTDIVVWYTMNYHHLPRPEDFPIQPVAYASFSLHPFGFFERNPTLDVPPASH